MLLSNFFQTLIIQFQNTSLLEIVAVTSSLIYLYLATKQNKWCFLFGLISSAIYVYICFEIKLYFDTFINLYYVLMSVIGFISWNSIKTKNTNHISKISTSKFLIYSSIGLILSLVVGFYASRYTDASFPFIDAFTTVFALIATWMVIKKYIENWLIWIIVDGISIVIYQQKALIFTAFLFFIYTIIAIKGYFQWRKQIN